MKLQWQIAEYSRHKGSGPAKPLFRQIAATIQNKFAIEQANRLHMRMPSQETLQKLPKRTFLFFLAISPLVLIGLLKWPINLLLDVGYYPIALLFARAPDAALFFGILLGTHTILARWKLAARVTLPAGLVAALLFFYVSPVLLNANTLSRVKEFHAADMQLDGRKAPGNRIGVLEDLKFADDDVPLPGCHFACVNYLRKKPEGTITHYRKLAGRKSDHVSPPDAHNYMTAVPEDAVTFAAYEHSGEGCGYNLTEKQERRYKNTTLGAFDIKDGWCIHQVENPDQLDLIVVENRGYLIVDEEQGDRMLLPQEFEVWRKANFLYDVDDVIHVRSELVYRRSPDGPEAIYRYSISSPKLVPPFLSISIIKGLSLYYDTNLGFVRKDYLMSGWNERPEFRASQFPDKVVP